jgi:hypothetical protein
VAIDTRRLTQCTIFAAGVLTCLVLTRNGMAVSPDSGNYLAGAQSLCANGSYLGTDGRPITYWPPGYSMLLAAPYCAGGNLLVAARYLNALLLGAIGTIAWLWIYRTTSSVTLATIIGVGCVVASPLGELSQYVLSDLLFTVLVCAALYQLSTADSSRAEFLASLLFAAAVATRFAGLVLPVILGIAVLMSSRGTLAERAIRGMLLCIVVVLPLGAFAIRNVLHGLPPGGVRGPSGVGFDSMLSLSLQTTGRWFLPGTIANQTAAMVVVVAVLAAATFWWLRLQPGAGVRRAGLLAAASVVCYSVFVALAAVTSGSDVPTPRIQAPIYVPLVAWGTLVAVTIVHRFTGRQWRVAATAALIVLVALVPCRRMYERARRPTLLVFNDPAWKTSDTAAWVADHVSHEVLFATRPVVLFVHHNIRSYEGPLAHPYQMPTTPTDDVALIDSLLAAGRTPYLVRFADGVPKEAMSLTELQSRYQIEKIYTGQDGTVHLVRARRW